MANGDYAVTNTGTDVHNSRLPDSVVVRILAETIHRLGYRPHTRRPLGARRLDKRGMIDSWKQGGDGFSDPALTDRTQYAARCDRVQWPNREEDTTTTVADN